MSRVGKTLTLCLMRSWFPRRWSRSNRRPVAVEPNLAPRSRGQVPLGPDKVRLAIHPLVFRDHWVPHHLTPLANLRTSIIRLLLISGCTQFFFSSFFRSGCLFARRNSISCYIISFHGFFSYRIGILFFYFFFVHFFADAWIEILLN